MRHLRHFGHGQTVRNLYRNQPGLSYLRCAAEDAQPLGKKILDTESRRIEIYVQKRFAVDDRQLIDFFRNIPSFLFGV